MVVATNFLLLDKLKRSQQIVNANLQVRCSKEILFICKTKPNISFLQYTIVNEVCDSDTNLYSADIQISVSHPAVFVYIQIKNPKIKTYALSKNGFIQLSSIDSVAISFHKPNCAVAFAVDDLQILTVNEFLT